MTELPTGISGTVLTALLPLLTGGVLAIAKFVADVRRQLDQMRTLMLGFEGQGGGLLDQLQATTVERQKVERDLNAAWARIRALERVAGITPEPFTTTERSAGR